MSSSPVRSALTRATRQVLPWILALAVATCSDDATSPSRGGVGYVSFRPVYSGVTSSLSQFGIVADSVHIRLTRPVDQLVLDTTVFFPPDSTSLSLALPVALDVSPEILSALIEISAGGVVLFVDTLEVTVVDGPPGSSQPATATLEYVGPGNNIKSIAIIPADTTIFFGDTLFYTSSAIDSSDLAVVDYYVGWKSSDTSFAKVNSQGRLIAPNVRGTFKVIGYTPTGIADTADITIAPVPSQLLADSGAAQSALVGDSLATEFVARVMGPDNAPIEGINVRFLAVTAGGAVRDSILVTDANGRVRTRGVLGTATGNYTYSATVVGTAITTTWTATASAGLPFAIAVQSGDAQTDTAGRALPLPFTARVADAFDNPVSGAKVYWTRMTGTGTVAADSSFTDIAGLASVGYTLSAVGTDSIQSSLAGTSAFVWFTATAINGAPATVAILLGNAQTDTVGRLLTDSLAVTVSSATAFPVSGTPVVWTVLRGGVVTSDTTLTDSTGRAAVGYTLGTVTGTDSVRAQAGSATAIFVETAVTGAATTLAYISGDGQTDTTGRALPLPFVVQAADAFNNPVIGTNVLFTRTSGLGTLADDTVATDGAGNASVGYTLGASAGTDTITATLLCGCSTLTFTATAVPAGPASIVTMSGDSQTVVVNMVADTFEVVVRDGSSNPIAGAKVNWAFIPADGSFTEILPAGIQQTFTDSLGVARGIYTAGTSAGKFRVEAQIGALIDSLYVFVVPDVPSAIAINGGDAQSDTAGVTLSTPLSVRVADAYNNPVAGATVVFSTTAGDGSVVPDTVLTNAAGLAAATATLGTTPGNNTYRAALVGTSAFVDFNATGIQPTPFAIQPFSGDLQADTVARALQEQLIAQVFSAGLVPLPGATVIWHVIRGGTVSADTTVTDSAGNTSVNYTLGTQTGVDSVEARTLDGAVTFIFTASVVNELPGLMSSVSGDGQSDTAGFALSAPFVVRTTDLYGNIAGGAEVAFDVITGDGHVASDTVFSDVAGLASTTFTLGLTPGANVVRASLINTSATVDFTATGVVQAPASLIAASGSGQVDTVGRALTDSLVARVYNGGAAPIAGVPLVWTVIRGGTLDVDTTVSDSLGFVVAHYTLGTVSGIDSIQVQTIGGAITATFEATAVNEVASAIAIASGDAQVDTAGRALPIPLVARVTDAYGNPVKTAAVVLSITAGGGSFAGPDTTFTASDGTITTVWTLGAVAGSNTLRAALAGTSAFVDANATGVTAAAGALEANAGSGQTDTVGFTLIDSLKVRALDGLAAPITNATIVWTVTRGGAVAAETTYTDAGGYSATAYTLGTVAGEDSIEAKVLGSAPVALFLANALPGSGTAIAISGGNAQTDTIGVTLPQPLAVLVTDAYGNGSPFQQVVFSRTLGTGVLSNDTVQTDINGNASSQYTLGSVPAVDSIRAVLSGTSAFVDFSATAVAGVATSIIAYSGNGQSDTVFSTLTDSLVVELKDGSNGPVPGAWLYWVTAGATLSADSTLTDANGRAAVQMTLGTVALQSIPVAVRNADTTLATLFSITALPGTPTQLTSVSGMGQTGEASTALPIDFGALVQDAYGNPAAGVAVTWTNLAGFAAAGLPDTTLTDSIGVAYLTAPMLGPVVREDSLEAQILGQPATALFTATGTAGPAATLSYVSGTGQSDTVTRALPNPFRVLVQDAGGNPRSDEWVRFTQTSASGILSVDSVQSDASGAAEVSYTLGQVSGFDSVYATVAGLSDSVAFYAFAENDQATSIAVFSGDSGGATVGNPGGLPVVFILRDGYGNPVGDQSVTFAAIPGTSATQYSEATTGDDGLASAGFWTMDDAPGYNTLTASSGALNATATAIGMPVGTSSMWAGATSSDWETPSNWFGGTVPTSVDTVFIPAGTPNDPVLGATVTVARLVVAGTISIDLGSYTLTSENGVEGAAATFTSTTGALVVHGGSWNSTATDLVADSVVLGSGSVTNDLTVGLNGFDLGGHTLVVPGNVVLSGPLTMTSASDSLDIGGDLTVGYTDLAGATAAGTIVLRGNFVSNSLFRPVGSNTVVFAGASAQTATFGDASSSWFNTLVVDNAAGVQFLSNVQILGGAQQVSGHISGTNAAVTGNFVTAADSAWGFATTSFRGSAFNTVPDTMFGNVVFEFSGPVTLPGDLTVLGDLLMSNQAPVSLGPNALRVVGGLTQVSANSALVAQASAGTIEVGGLFSVDADSNDFSNGTLTLHGGLRQNGSSLFRPSVLYTTVFAGTGNQPVQFDNPGYGLSQSSFGKVEFADSVTFSGIAYVQGDVALLPGAAVASSNVLDLQGDLTGATWDNWRPTGTILNLTPSVLPDSLFGDVTLVQSATLAKAFTVGGDFIQEPGAGELDLNGFPMRVGGTLNVSGTVRMENAADSLDVGGTVLWTTDATAGLLTDGVIVAHGSFYATSLGNSFQPSGNHRVVFASDTAYTVLTVNPSSTNNSFVGLELRGSGTMLMNGALLVHGAMTESVGTPITLQGIGTVEFAGPTTLDSVVFDSVGVLLSASVLPDLHALTFQGRRGATNLEIVLPGQEATPIVFSDFTFIGPKDAGQMYVTAQDAVSDGIGLEVQMVNSTPLDGSALTIMFPGNDGSSVKWSGQVFASQPLNAEALATLAPVVIEVRSPDGTPLTSFTGAVTIDFDNNPASGVLSGTTTVNAVAGVATFDDLSIDIPGADYRLVATASGLQPAVSDDFAISVPLPVEFTTAWTGAASTDWNDAANWSGGLVPDATTNVFIAQPYLNAPVSTSSVQIGRLRIISGASLEVASSVLMADSSIQVAGTITGAGSFQPHGTGTINGDLQIQTIVSGTYVLDSTLKVTGELAVAGDLDVGNDSLFVTGLFSTLSNTGVLRMTDAAAVAVVDGDAQFDGGSTAGTLTDGILQVSGTLAASGSTLDAFAPSPAHRTILYGSSDQVVHFATPDSANGSHFGGLDIATNGRAVMADAAWVMGDLLVRVGATLTDSLGNGIAVMGLTSIDAGGSITPSRLAMAGVLSVAVGGTYGVPNTVYFGGSVPMQVNAAPYDTLQISRAAYAAEDLLVTGDLKIQDINGEPARFDIGAKTVTVNGDLSINGDGAPVMQDAAGHLLVKGNFATNGASTIGLLTAGTLEIDGSFDQAADGPNGGESFRASGTHTTVFTATGAGRYIDFDSPSGSPSDSTGSHFQNLVLDGPGTAMQGRVAAAGEITINGSVTKTEGFGMGLAGYGAVTIAATSDSVSLDYLEAWTGIIPQGGALYNVESTRLYGGGGDLPILPYQDLSIRDATFQLTTDQVITGGLDLGQDAPEVGCCVAGGDLQASGHVLTIQGSLGVNGLAYLSMAAGDSVDVSGSATFRGAPSDGYLTGGTLVVRGLFNTVGDSAFQASAAHRTVLLAAGVDDIYPTPDTWFGQLVLLDGAPRRIRTNYPLVVLDSLILGAGTAGLTDTTFGANNGRIEARGPVVTVSGSSLAMGGTVQFDHTSIFVSGDYSAATTVFNGTGQIIPVLPYSNVKIWGTATLSDSLNIGGKDLEIGGGGVPADLTMAGHTIRTGTFEVTGQGTITMASANDTLAIGNTAVFDGGNESGKLTAGTLILRDAFVQANTNSDSSFFASGSHLTIFADSTTQATVQLGSGSMIDGSSRFNDVEIRGRGVNFDAIAWIGGNTVVTEALDSVGAAQLILGGSLSDTSHKWLVGETFVNGVDPLLPDSMLRSVTWSGAVDTLESTMSVDGAVTVRGALVVNGQQFRAHSSFSTLFAGALDMTNAADQVTIDGMAQWSGGPETDLLTAGRLTLMGDFVRDSVPAMFDARGTHTTVLAGSALQTLQNKGINVYGGEGFNDLVTYNPNVSIGNGITVIGTLRDSVSSGTLFLSSPYSINGHYIIAGQVEITDAQFDEVILAMGDQSQLDTVTFNVTSPNEVITITGPGRPTPLDLHAINFPNWSTSGATMVVAVDNNANAEFLNVRMFGSTPFDGSTLDRVASSIGELPTITWSHLALPDGLPLTVDSLVPFDLTLNVVEPDGQSRADVIGSADITIAANPFGATLNGNTTATFDGQSATFNGLTLDQAGAGVSFHIEMQGRAVDSITTGTLDVINLAPAGAVVFTGLGGDGGLWTNPANWSAGVPLATDSVFIPGGAFVSFDAGADTVGTIVLGSGASLDLNGGTLTSTGNVFAGQTIGGPGYLEVAGGASQISGTFSSLRITGSVSAAAPTTLTGDLIIDGAAAEFNVGGQNVNVAGNLYTQNGGVFTMDGATDTLTVDDASIFGGDETGKLTDGVLIFLGSIDQGGDPNSFNATLNHTTIFADGGSSEFVDLGYPQSSGFAHLKILNTNGLDLNESGNDFVRVDGDLTMGPGASANGDTLKVAGVFSMTGTSSIDLGTLVLGSAPNLAGTYTVGTTNYFGSPFAIPAAPQDYDHLRIDNTATLGDSITAKQVEVTGNGQLDVGGSILVTDTLLTSASGVLIMGSAGDRVIVEKVAQFLGGDEAGWMSYGLLEIHGDLQTPSAKFQASGSHVTRFTGQAGGVHVLQLSANIICEGSCSAPPSIFATIEVVGDTLALQDDQNGGLHVGGDLNLLDGTLYGAGLGRSAFVAGELVADVNSYVTVNKLTLSGGLDVNQYHYNVFWTVFAGVGQTIPSQPYQTLSVTGSASLGEPVAANYVTLDSSGVLTMAGQWMKVNNNFTANAHSHLMMNNEADSLDVSGKARFQSDSTYGDFTAGVIVTGEFYQSVGSSGDQRSYVESGTHRIRPVNNALIQMNTPGPSGSYLRAIDFSGAGDALVQGIWVDDSLIINDPTTTLAADTGLQFVVGNHYVQGSGTVNIPRLALGGTLDFTGGTYVVDTTVFGGGGQIIPNNVPYANINVQYDAKLAGDIDLRSTGNSLLVENSGDLDINGFNLEANEFRTTGYGRLTMDDPADTLIAVAAYFGGDSTNLSLTSGTIITQYLEQTVGFPASNKEYAPTGTHRLVLQDLGSAGDGVSVSLASPGLTDGSHANVLVVDNYGMIMTPGQRVVVADTFYLNRPLNGASGSAIEVYGPAVIDSLANVNLDSLIVHDTLAVNPLATYNVTTTVFETGAAPMPALGSYGNVVILGDQTLTAPITVGGDLYLKGNGVLTPNAQKVSGANVLFVQDNAHLVMANVADTVEMGDANFDGAASGSDLAAGILRVRSGLVSGNTFTTQNFAPTGMMVEFYGGGSANVAFAVASPDNSFIDSLRVIEGTTISPQTYFLVMGPALFKDGSTLDGNSSSSAIDFRGKVSVLDSSKVNDGGSSTLFFSDSLFVNTPSNYNVGNTYFSNTNGIPDLAYQYLTLGDGVYDTLTHPLTAINQLLLTASTSGAQDLVLNGHKVTTGYLSTGGFARFRMDSVADTMEVTGSALIGGDDLTSYLTSGVIRLGGDFTQNSFTSTKSFVATGTRTEFVGTGTHALVFGHAAPGLSHFADLALLDGGTLRPTTSISVLGTTTIDTSSIFDGQFMTGAHTAEFFGKVNILALGQVNDPGFSSMFFHDSLIVNPTASYSAFNTVFQDTDGIPDASYVHMYLRQGVHLTLTHPLYMTGSLNIQNDAGTGNPADTVTIRLNGHKVNAYGFGITGYGRLTMDNPADTLDIASAATFGGLDQDTSMTAGVLRIGGYIQQIGAYSTRSFAPAGTLTEFYGSTSHNAVFADPGTGQSHFGPISVINAGTLQPTTGFVVVGSTTIGSTAHFDGQSIPNGNTVDFFGPVNVLSGGDFHSGASLAYFNFYGPNPLTVANGATTPYAVVNTGFSNTGNSLPDLPYENLYLTDGVHDTLTFSPSITGVLSLSAVSPGAQDLVLNGQVMSVGAFITQDEGRLTMNNVNDYLTTMGDATFTGGSTTGRLTAGVLEVRGDFVSGTGTSFNADSLFQVDFTGGGNHQLVTGAGGAVFGYLSIGGEGADSDTLTTPGDLYAYRFGVSGGARVIGFGNAVHMQRASISDATFDGLAVYIATGGSQPQQFTDVTFASGTMNAFQAQLTFYGEGTYTFQNITFDDFGGAIWVEAQDLTNSDPRLDLQIQTTQYVNGPSHESVVDGATLSWVDYVAP